VSAAQLLLVTLVVGGGAALQAVLGFGLGLIAAPVLALVDPTLVPGPLLFVMVPLTLLVARRERGSLDLRGIRWALAGRIPGTIAGSLAVAALPERHLAILLGGVVLLAVVLSVAGWRVRPTSSTLLMAGAASGFMGTATSIGGPPMALVYQRRSGPELRATLAAYFVVGAAFSLATLSVAGEFDGAGLAQGLWLLPGVLAGYATSGHLARFLDGGHTRTAVLVASASSATVLILRHLV
jgi:uncharacterized membrane protein YfcA